MTVMNDALKEAGASEESFRKAATVIADYDSKLTGINTKLSVALWAGGLLFAAILTSQAALWIEMGRLDGHLSQIRAQVNHIEQMVALQGARP